MFRAEGAGARPFMSVESLIPNMSEAELETLEANATRISRGAASKQQAEAARLLPIIAEALVARRGANSVAAAEKKAARAKDLADARAARTAKKKAASEGEA